MLKRFFLLLVWLSLCVSCFAQTAVELPHPAVRLIDALQSTLQKDPDIQLQQQQLNLNRGVLQAASGQFDTSVNASILQNHLTNPLTSLQELQYAQAGIFTSALASNTTTYTLGVQKLFRDGITIGPNLSLNRNTDNITTQYGLNQSQLAFQVTLPLLRGRGRDAVDAQERSSRSTVEASLRDVNQEIAQLLTTTAVQYWNAVAAARDLVIAKDSEQRGRKYEQDVQTLIDKDRVPRGEINQLLANLDNRTASRIAAEQQLAAAQQSLALAMGLRSDEITVLPQATDALPDWTGKGIPKVTPQLTKEFVASALSARADMIAANFQLQAARQILPAAHNQLLPQLNVNFSAGYSGLMVGTAFGRPFIAPFNNVRGANVIGSINWAFPFRNDTAIGQLAQARASYEQAVLNQANVAREISSSVVTAMTGLVYSVSAVRKAREAVSYYRLALSNEVEKFHLGMNTLVDVITMEDYLTSALQAEVSAEFSYAQALANLRFATGTVVNANTRVHNLNDATFLHPPFGWELK
jgi:outer membrane protein